MPKKSKKQQQSESSEVPWYMEPEYKRTEDRMAELINSAVIPDVYPPPPEWDPDAPEYSMTSEELQEKWEKEFQQKIENIMGGPPPKQKTD